MLCCAMGIAAVATGAIGWRRFRRCLTWRLNAQTALTGVVAAMVAMMAAGVMVDHLRHHGDYAADGQTVLTDLGALPLCRGTSPTDRTRTIASVEE